MAKKSSLKTNIKPIGAAIDRAITQLQRGERSLRIDLKITKLRVIKKKVEILCAGWRIPHSPLEKQK